MKKGFTLIELLVVIVIIGILVAIALPNFIKIKDKAKEAEVKQNLHSIQLAVERYQVDSGASYPFFLYGGDPAVNQGTAIGVYGNPSMQSVTIIPFDMFHMTTNTWDYNDTNWNELLSGDAGAAFGDTLQYEGYMPKYPRNPFQAGAASRAYGISHMNTTNAGQAMGSGGRDGVLMWNIGQVGESPRFKFYTGSVANSNQYPGTFYYHPRFQDGITNIGHQRQQAPYNPTSQIPGGTLLPPLNDSADVSSLEVAGYDLLASGSIRTLGQDLDTNLTVFTTGDFRTGYLTLGQERNPWVTTPSNFSERQVSDSVPDFWIVHLGSGLDKKVGSATAE